MHQSSIRLMGLLMFPESPSLSVSVGNIVGGSTYEQVVGVATSGVVAMVANKHAVGDWPLVKLVRKSVHLYDLPSNLEHAIAICVTCASVLPTFSVRAMRQKFKEAIGRVVGPPRQPAFYRAVPPSPFSRWGRGEILATAFAGKNKGRVFALLGAEPRSIDLRGLNTKVLTTPFTDYVVRGILGAHMNCLSCAMPSTVTAVRGLSCASYYTKFRMVAGDFEGVTV